MLPAVHVTIWAILLHFKSFIFSMLVKSSARKLFAEIHLPKSRMPSNQQWVHSSPQASIDGDGAVVHRVR